MRASDTSSWPGLHLRVVILIFQFVVSAVALLIVGHGSQDRLQRSTKVRGRFAECKALLSRYGTATVTNSWCGWLSTLCKHTGQWMPQNSGGWALIWLFTLGVSHGTEEQARISKAALFCPWQARPVLSQRPLPTFSWHPVPSQRRTEAGSAVVSVPQPT